MPEKKSPPIKIENAHAGRMRGRFAAAVTCGIEQHMPKIKSLVKVMRRMIA